MAASTMRLSPTRAVSDVLRYYPPIVHESAFSMSADQMPGTDPLAVECEPTDAELAEVMADVARVAGEARGRRRAGQGNGLLRRFAPLRLALRICANSSTCRASRGGHGG